MITKQHKIGLRKFFRELKKWIDAGQPEENNHSFKSDCGICDNLLNYGYSATFSYEYELKLRDLLDIKLKRYAERIKIPQTSYPFNESRKDFQEEWDKYTNKKRLAFIKRQARMAIS